jgi:putative hydrolase of the HAD superfamily
VPELLRRLKERHVLAIVTDGLATMQRNKVAALGIEPLVDSITYCWECCYPKPSVEPFREALQRHGIPAQNAVIVGDNPDHDLVAAEALAMPAIRVLTGRHANRPAAKRAQIYEARSILEIEPLVARLLEARYE